MKQIKTIIAAICRTLLGVVFVFSGVVKAIDPLGTVYKIEDYLKAFGGVFTDLLPMAEVAAWGLILQVPTATSALTGTARVCPSTRKFK